MHILCPGQKESVLRKKKEKFTGKCFTARPQQILFFERLPEKAHKDLQTEIESDSVIHRTLSIVHHKPVLFQGAVPLKPLHVNPSDG